MVLLSPVAFVLAPGSPTTSRRTAMRSPFFSRSRCSARLTSQQHSRARSCTSSSCSSICASSSARLFSACFLSAISACSFFIRCCSASLSQTRTSTVFSTPSLTALMEFCASDCRVIKLQLKSEKAAGRQYRRSLPYNSLAPIWQALLGVEAPFSISAPRNPRYRHTRRGPRSSEEETA
uniref:Uncharacterized protein TCIL3000_7_3450 n=1 Tax=Trypanosoma congolense (strain IL3000) TaxID=1068625 RepID=G0UQ70_TRYCI|nr:unnamed protein product [Trypanosoma congolense IL3000]